MLMQVVQLILASSEFSVVVVEYSMAVMMPLSLKLVVVDFSAADVPVAWLLCAVVLMVPFAYPSSVAEENSNSNLSQRVMV